MEVFRLLDKCGNAGAVGDQDGAEDFAMTSDDIVLISSGLVWPVLQPVPKHGRILSLKLGQPETEMKPVELING